ncbi:hypothetical protein K438DRAFT_1941899 [Mycena galopus ATCC 62051]|nr:hypothetical protein K438DRAFT_1941899 [Mycena galopus ATCC 62051]
MPHPAGGSQTVNIHGGPGGNGGTGGVSGGGGGAGEGPRTTVKYIKTESFTINNNLSMMEQPRSDFCHVSLGDLNLLDEINQESVVKGHPIYRRRTGAFVRHISVVVGTRRVHRARIFGHQDPMTVVVYDGSNFEQIKAQVLEAQRHRHPFLAQLFGFTCLAGLNALIYHDDIMTISQIKKMHAQSALASTYIRHEMLQHFELTITKAAFWYWEENTGTMCYDLPGTAWIRLTTGKLCLDIGDGVTQCIAIYIGLTPNMLDYMLVESFKLTENELHTKLLHALELDEFHVMLGQSGQWHSNNLPSSTESITLPSICILSDRVNSNSHQLLTIPFTTSSFTEHLPLRSSWNCHSFRSEVMPTGWTW